MELYCTAPFLVHYMSSLQNVEVSEDTQLLLHTFLDNMCYSQKPQVKIRNGAAQLISNALHVSLAIVSLVMTHNYISAEMHCCTLSCFMNMRRRMATS